LHLSLLFIRFQMIQTARNWYMYSKKKIKVLTRIRGSKSKREADMTDSDNKRHCLYTSQSQEIAIKEQETESKETGPIDPISLEVIDPSRITILNGISYDHVTLIQYFTSTMNFRGVCVCVYVPNVLCVLCV